MNYTKGPWKIEEQNQGKTLIITSKKMHIASLIKYGSVNRLVDEFDKANAQLIASAPDLLEACKRTIGTIGKKNLEEWAPNLKRALEQAISKAERKAS